MAVTYQFAPDNSRMRAVSLVPWGASGLLIPLWPKTPKVWRFSGAVLTSAAIQNLSSSCGFGGAASDGASGAWAVQYTGSLVSYSSGGAASGFPLPTGNAYNGCAYLPAFARPYVSTSTGLIYAGSGAVLVGGGAGFNAPTWGLAGSGSTLFALTSGSLATFTLTGASAGFAGNISYPMNVADCISASAAASAVAVGGWGYYTLASGYTNITFSPASPVMLALNSGPKLDLYLGPNEVWVLTQSLAVSGNPSFAAWKPDGTAVLVSDPVGNTVNIYNYSLGVLTLAQSLNIVNASALAVTPDGTKALVCQPILNSVVPLTVSGSVLTAGTPFSLPVPGAVAMTANASAAVGTASGVAMLRFTAGAWATSGTVMLPYAPSAVALGSGGVVLSCGTVGSSGFFSASLGLANLFTYSWFGSASSVIYDQGQVTVADPSTPLLWAFGNLFSDYLFIYTIVPTQTLNNLSVSLFTSTASGGTIFGTGPFTTSLYQYTTPYNLEPKRTGVVSIYGSGGWSTAQLGSGHVPTALTFDASGNVWAATLQSDLYKISPSGAVLSSSGIPAFSGQAASGVPLGISAMTTLGSSLYAASSLSGPLIKLF